MNQYQSTGVSPQASTSVKRAITFLVAATFTPFLFAQGQGQGGGNVAARLDALEAQVSQLQNRVAALESLLTHVSRSGNEIYISGANLHLINGLGATNGLPNDPFSSVNQAVNGLGNLIVGYNEERVTGTVRTGSHNVIIGTRHNYSTYSGLITGNFNQVGDTGSVGRGGVAFGQGNRVLADFGTITGGRSNTVTAAEATVSGGTLNQATATWSAISGGVGITISSDSGWAAGSNGASTVSGNFRSL